MLRPLRVAALPVLSCLLTTSCFVLDRADAIEDGAIVGSLTFSGSGVADGIVSIRDNQRSVRSDDGGRFALRGLDAGTYGVRLFDDVDDDGIVDRGAVRQVLLERGTFDEDDDGNRVERVFGVDLGDVVLEDSVTVRGFVRDGDADSDPLTSTVVVVRPGFGTAAEQLVTPGFVEGSPQFSTSIVPGTVQVVAFGAVRGRSSDVETIEVALFDDANRPTLTVDEQADVRVAVTMPAAPPRSRVVIVAAGAPRPAPSTPGAVVSEFATVPVGVADAWVFDEGGRAIGVLRNQVALPGIAEQTWGPVLPCEGNACGDGGGVDPGIDVDAALAIIEGVKIRALFQPDDTQILVSYDRPELREISARLRCDDVRSQPGMLVNDNFEPFTLRVGRFNGAPPTPMSPVTCAMCTPDGTGDEACVDDIVQVFFADGVYIGPEGGGAGDFLANRPEEWLGGVVPDIETFSSGAAQLVITEDASTSFATDLTVGALDVRGSLQIAGPEQHLTVTDLIATSNVGLREVRGAGRIRMRGDGKLAVNLVDTMVLIGADDPDDPDDDAAVEGAAITIGHVAGVHLDNSVMRIGDLGNVDLPALLDERIPVVDNGGLELRNDTTLEGSSGSVFSTSVDLLVNDSDVALLGGVGFTGGGIIAQYEGPHELAFEDATIPTITVTSSTGPTIRLVGVLRVGEFKSTSSSGGNGATFEIGSFMTVDIIDVPGFISGEMEILAGASGHLQQVRVTSGNTVDVIGTLRVGTLDVEAGGTFILRNDVGATVLVDEGISLFGTIEFGRGAHLQTAGLRMNDGSRLELDDDGILELVDPDFVTATLDFTVDSGAVIEAGSGHLTRISQNTNMILGGPVTIDDLELVGDASLSIEGGQLAGDTATVAGSGFLNGSHDFTTCNNCAPP